MALAQEWQRRIDIGEVPSRAALARELGVTRAHVTQVLRLLQLAPDVEALVLSLGDPMEGNVIGAHTLRSFVTSPPDVQIGVIRRRIGHQHPEAH